MDMPLTSRRTLLAGVSTLLGVMMPCTGCASRSMRSDSLAGVGPMEEPRWRWPGDGILAKIGAKQSAREIGPSLSDSEPAMLANGSATPGALQATGTRWRWPGTAYSESQPSKDGPVLVESSSSPRTIAATDGLKWRWPGMNYGPSVEKSAAVSDKQIAAASDTSSPRGVLGGVKWRWPATGYSAGASATDAADTLTEQPVAEKTASPSAASTGTGVKWRWPATSYRTEA